MKFRLILVSVLVSISLFAQRAADGEKFFNNKQFEKAKIVYETLLKQRPGNALYNYRLARCYYELNDSEKAINYFELSGTRYTLCDLYLGELYFNTYRFEKSITAYETYISSLKPEDDKIEKLESKLTKSRIGARLIKKVNDIAIVDSVVVNKNDFLHFYKMGSELGTIKQESIKLKSNLSVDKVKYSTQRQDRIYYSDLVNGQLDIFTSYKLLDEWSKPIPISEAINTYANENYPFLSLDGITLYFASNGENSIGGYDIFVTRYNSSNSSYLPPENIGMPFNSPANDYMMVIDELHKLGWFATDRNQPDGKVVIYTFVPNELKTIIRSEDQELVRQVAKLKKYRTSTNTNSKSPSQIQNQTEETKKTENQIQFIINDSVVYLNISQFKSEEAVRLWNELSNTSNDLQIKKTQLENLRKSYSDSIDETKGSLNSSILDLEKTCSEMSNSILQKAMLIRNEENKYLREHKL